MFVGRQLKEWLVSPQSKPIFSLRSNYAKDGYIDVG
jgi:hypothetical protein